MLIELKNVSKFYYSKGIIASGFSRVNLSFDVGEFVVITGESGSGKTTLLNVISGLDSYEEGEMYIEGKETSHYFASDFENYRKKYIGNIFQNFNLVGSYTVYQNVELILRINGYSKEEMKEKIDSILERVGMSEYSKTKVSKLSGGQKQRVAIARALAKDTAIVVADEPTGNLDSESAEGIVKLLREISRDKLVIVVTHNYDQFEKHATRKIKMYDGKVVEDERLKEPAAPALSEKDNLHSGEMSAASKVRLGLRNTFNLKAKFLLILTVFIFVVMAVTAGYTSYQHTEAEMSRVGWNDYFNNYSENRVILKKQDGTAFTEDDYKALEKINNINRVVKEDMMLDSSLYIESDQFTYDPYPVNIKDFKGDVVYGRLPENDNEVLLTGYEDDYLFVNDHGKELLDKTYDLSSWSYDRTEKVTVVGIAMEEGERSNWWYSGRIYMTDAMMQEMIRDSYSSNSKASIIVNGTELIWEMNSSYYRPIANSNVPQGKALVSDELNSYYKNGKATGQKMTVNLDSFYYDTSLELQINGTYNKKNFTSKTGLKSFEDNEGAIFINPADYNKLFWTEQYQATVYIENMKDADATVAKLEKSGYITLPLKDTLNTDGNEIVSVIQVPMIICLLIAVFFISYFVIHLILRSRSSYFSILRMLGLAKKNIRRIMDVELFTVVNIAYALFLIMICLVNMNVLNVEYIRDLVQFMEITDYVLLYGILVVMSYLISGKFVRKMFKKTAMGSYRGEE